MRKFTYLKFLLSRLLTKYSWTVLETAMHTNPLSDRLTSFSSAFIYLLTAWSRVLLEKLTGFAANQEIPRILWNPKFHYLLTSTRHFLSLHIFVKDRNKDGRIGQYELVLQCILHIIVDVSMSVFAEIFRFLVFWFFWQCFLGTFAK